MKFSVALCTYNGEKFLSEQLDSILMQSEPVHEIIVCDDKSTDSTPAILRSYKSKYPDIFRIFFNDKNMGYVDNFEQALQKCTGDYIFLSDQDDLWLPEKISTTKTYIEENTEKDLFCHNLDILKPNGDIVSKSFFDNKDFDISFSNSQILSYLVFEKNVFPGMSMCISSRIRNRYFPLQKINPKIIHDYELAIKGTRDDKLIIIPQVLAHYRQHNLQSIGIDVDNLVGSLNIQSIHSKIQRISTVKHIIQSFSLNPNLLNEYKQYCRNLYKRYLHLQKFPFFEHLKVKYYYKILNGFK